MVNTADVRKHLEAVETAERHLDMIKAFAAKGGAYKLGITVDTKEAWEGAQISGIISQYLAKLPILASAEKFLKEEIEQSKNALLAHVAEEQAKQIEQEALAAMATEIPQFIKRAK